MPYFPGTAPGRPNDTDQVDNRWDVVVAKVIWPIPDKGLNKRIHRIIAPSLIVWGENGRVIRPVYAQTFSKAINNAEVFMSLKCDHEPPLELCEALTARVLAFFGEREVDGGGRANQLTKFQN